MKSKQLLMGSALVFAAAVSTGTFADCAPDAPGACTEMLLQSNVTWDGMPIRYLRTKNPELTIRTIQFAPGTYNKWHIHEAPVYIYVMSGSFDVILADGRKETWFAGQAFNEVMNTVHYGGNPSATEWTKLVIMSPSIKDCPFMTAWPLVDGPQCHEDEGWFDQRKWWRDGLGRWGWH